MGRCGGTCQDGLAADSVAGLGQKKDILCFELDGFVKSPKRVLCKRVFGHDKFDYYEFSNFDFQFLQLLYRRQS